jgi:hypothetical protein
VGHDADKSYADMKPREDFGNKVILADCKRSSGYSTNTEANYGIIDSKLLAGENFPEVAVNKETITRQDNEDAARSSYRKYLRQIAEKKVTPEVKSEIQRTYTERFPKINVNREIITRRDNENAVEISYNKHLQQIAEKNETSGIENEMNRQTQRKSIIKKCMIDHKLSFVDKINKNNSGIEITK